jgi:hypothetical protein
VLAHRLLLRRARAGASADAAVGVVEAIVGQIPIPG